MKMNVCLTAFVLIVASMIGIITTTTVMGATYHDASVYVNDTRVYNDTSDDHSFAYVNHSGYDWYYGVSCWYDINLKISGTTGFNYYFEVYTPPSGWDIDIYDNDNDDGPAGNGTDIDQYLLYTEKRVLDFDGKFVVIPPINGTGGLNVKLQMQISWTDTNNDEVDFLIINFTGNVSELPFEISTQDSEDAIEDTPYSIDYDTLIDNDIAQWMLNTDADWLGIDFDGFLNGTPDNTDVGQYWVNVTAFNGVDYDSHNFTLTVANVEPVLSGTNVVTTNEDEPYSVIYTSDDDVSWAVDTNASWLGIADGVLSGAPGNEDVGNYYVNVSIDDGNGGTDYIEFNLTVSPVNDKPILVGDPDTDAYEDLLYAYEFGVTDVDSGVFQWALATDAEFLLITGSNVSGMPDNDDVGQYFVNVTVDDGNLFDFINYTLTVHNVNDIPIWVDTPDNIMIDEDTNYTFDANATDIDNETLSYDIVGPTDITINNTGMIEWLSVTAGNYTVVITASDGIADIDHTFIIAVQVVPKPIDIPDDNTTHDNTTTGNDDDNTTVDDDITIDDDDIIDDDNTTVDDDITIDDDDTTDNTTTGDDDDDIIIPDDDNITNPNNNETDPPTASNDQRLPWFVFALIAIGLIILVIIIIVIMVIVKKSKKKQEPQDHYPAVPPIEPEVEYSPGSPGIQPEPIEAKVGPVEIEPDEVQSYEEPTDESNLIEEYPYLGDDIVCGDSEQVEQADTLLLEEGEGVTG